MTDSPRRQAPILVTGAAGFLGSALCHRLRALGRPTVAYDNLSRGRRSYLPDDVEFVEGDIRDATRVRAAISASKPDCVIHLAAMHFIPHCDARPDETHDVNVEGTQRVVEACRESSVRSFVFASTAAVYAPTDRACVEDATPLGPMEVYGRSKLAAEELVEAWHRETRIATTVVRLFNAVGRNETNPHVVPHIIESLQRSDVIQLGNTAPRRDYIDTRDVAEAIIAVAEDTSREFRVFNVGTGKAYSVQDILESLARILGRTIETVQDPSRIRTVDRMLLVADIRRIRAATGWQPRISFEETLADIVDAYRLRAQPHSAR
jgi:UDP-glucose 4-epimerase